MRHDHRHASRSARRGISAAGISRSRRATVRLGAFAAVSIRAARIKHIVSPVAGQADILVVPDLESGNMLAKQLEYLADAESAGIVLGARVPIVLTSRADSAKARLASCAVMALLAHAGRRSQSAQRIEGSER